ncbi:helix-turn-helix transcriptional regulator [Enterococcus durans]|uniref:helix-turn-helix transcriptional regulator n=1 Tax=Enterococcus durans TaxID=53345 RepID=UPI001D09DCC5|nr:hypothetical protein [Enterococcus durans]MCB8516815.1 hypothetical protein [Enterococcus durans]
MNNKVVGYRKMLGYTQKDMAEKFNISRQSYHLKETGKIAFNDREKVKFKKMLQPLFADITVDDIFFN